MNGINPLPLTCLCCQLIWLILEGPDLLPPSTEGFTGRGVSTPFETFRGNNTEDTRHFCLGSINDQAYGDGLHVVVNLSSRTITQAKNALPSAGLSFWPTPTEIDEYALKKDVLEYLMCEKILLH